jgi:hypothetical protein
LVSTYTSTASLAPNPVPVTTTDWLGWGLAGVALSTLAAFAVANGVMAKTNVAISRTANIRKTPLFMERLAYLRWGNQHTKGRQRAPGMSGAKEEFGGAMVVGPLTDVNVRRLRRSAQSCLSTFGHISPKSSRRLCAYLGHLAGMDRLPQAVIRTGLPAFS